MSPIRITALLFGLILAGSPGIRAQNLHVPEPVAGYHGQAGSVIHVGWTGLPPAVAVRISRWAAGDGKWTVIVEGYRSDSSRFDWQLSSDLPLGAYRIKVEELNSRAVAISGAFFYVDAGSSAVTEEFPGNAATIAENDIEQDSEVGFAIFPNPARDHLRVESARSGVTELMVATMQGNEVARVRVDQANTSAVVHLPSALPSGRYLIVVRYDDNHIRTGSFDIVK